MSDDPYASLGSPIDVAPQKGAPAPAPTDAYSNVGSDPNAPARVEPVGYEQVGGFSDELPRHANSLPPDVEKEVVNILSTHPVDTAASDARQYLSGKGYNAAAATDPKFADSFDQVIAYRKTHGVVSDSVINHMPDPKLSGQPLDASAAGVRGAGDSVTAGLITHLDSAIHAAKDVVTGDTHGSVGEDFNRWEDVNQGILQADEANHPHARLVGQLLGGLAIPTGLEGVGLEAGKSVLVTGGTMREARAAAAAAVRNRIAIEGGAYGTVHGAATADPGHRVAGAVTGGTVGAAGGYALAAGAQVAPKIAAPIVEKISGLVDNTSGAASPDYVQIARDLNIQRTPATNSRSGVSTVVQAGLGALPGGAPVAAAADRETAGLGDAARSVAEGVGPVSTRQGAGEAIAEGAKSYKANSKQEATSRYNMRDLLMGGQGAPVPTDEASTAIKDMAARFPNSPAIQQLREHPAIRAIADVLPDTGGQPLTLGEVTEALSHVRGVKRNLAAQSNTTGPQLARVSQLEQALENDVMTAARKADFATGRTPGAEGSAVKAQTDADAFYADRASALNGSLKKALKSANDDTQVSGEAVYNQVAHDMGTNNGNLARLRDTWFRLPPEAKQTFAATRIDDLGRANPSNQNDIGDAWSFNKFLTNWNTLSPQSRNIVFGTQANEQLGKIATYANRLRQLDRARNFSNTAQKYFAGAFMATVGGAVLHGDIGGAVEAAMAVPATWGGAKLLLGSPAMRDWTAKAFQAVASGNEAGLKVLTAKLSKIAASEPTIAGEALGLQRAIERAANDNLHSLAASGSQQNPQGKTKQPQGAR